MGFSGYINHSRFVGVGWCVDHWSLVGVGWCVDHWSFVGVGWCVDHWSFVGVGWCVDVLARGGCSWRRCSSAGRTCSLSRQLWPRVPPVGLVAPWEKPMPRLCKFLAASGLPSGSAAASTATTSACSIAILKRRRVGWCVDHWSFVGVGWCIDVLARGGCSRRRCSSAGRTCSLSRQLWPRVPPVGLVAPWEKPMPRLCKFLAASGLPGGDAVTAWLVQAVYWQSTA